VTTEERRQVRARSFAAAAAEYERARPSYPAEAIDWLLPPGARRVLDLGAGTGKLTRQLRERGLEVVAVEPLASMREQLTAVVPDVRVLEGTAESIPLDDHSVDAVLVAQAWHWVDPPRAVPEVARVLAPGGWLGLVWNDRDQRQGWLADLGELLTRHGAESNDDLDPPVVGPPFKGLEGHQVRWSHRTTPGLLEDLVASRSYVITLPAAERRRLLDQVHHLVESHRGLAGAAEISVPYLTRCFRTGLA
jgi:SAM-dependent methyltransferase